MTPIPGEPLDPKQPELETSDGRKVKLKMPAGMTPLKPNASEQRGAAEPPREDPRAPVDPNHTGF